MHTPRVTETAFRVLPVQPEPYPVAEQRVPILKALSWVAASIVRQGREHVFWNAPASTFADIEWPSLSFQLVGSIETFEQEEARGRPPSFVEYMDQVKTWAEAYDREPAPMTPEEFGAILDDIHLREAEL